MRYDEYIYNPSSDMYKFCPSGAMYSHIFDRKYMSDIYSVIGKFDFEIEQAFQNFFTRQSPEADI